MRAMGKGSKRDKGAHRSDKKQNRQHLDQKAVQSFAKVLMLDGYTLKEVGRDGNCFFRSLSDQCEGNDRAHDTYRQRVVDYVEAHEDEFSPFMSFGESEEEEDKDFASYCSRMRSDGEWAGQVELIAAAQALRMHIVVHQHEHPTYRIECQAKSGRSSKKESSGKKAEPREIHLSYHDGEHYNSVHVMGRKHSGIGPAALGAAEGASGTDGGGSGHRGGGAFDALQTEGEDAPTSDEAEDAGVDGAADGVAKVSLERSRAPALATASTSDDGQGPSEDSTAHHDASEDSRKLIPKARRKEEKRRKKEQKYRKALAEAGGEVPMAAEPSGATKADGGEHGRSVITL